MSNKANIVATLVGFGVVLIGYLVVLSANDEAVHEQVQQQCNSSSCILKPWDAGLGEEGGK